MMDRKRKCISIIIVTWNGKKYIEALLSSLSKKIQKYPDVEVIIVDNGSSDGTPEIVESFAKVLKEQLVLKRLSKNLGFAGGNNIGIKLAKGDLIFLLNQDTYLSNDAFEHILQIFSSDPRVGAVQCLLLQYRYPCLLDSCGDEFSSIGIGIIGCLGDKYEDALKKIRKREITLARGAALIIRRKILDLSRRIYGTYLPTYLVAAYYEDWFLSAFTRASGYRILLIPECKVYHDSLKPIYRDPYTLYNAVNIFIQFRAPISMILGTIGVISFSSLFISKQPLKLLLCLISLLRKFKKNLQIRFYLDELMKLRGVHTKNIWKGKKSPTTALRWYFGYQQLIREVSKLHAKF